MQCVRLRLFVGLLVTFLVLGSPFIGDVTDLGGESKDPLNLALIWHQHQPLYKNTSTGRCELLWASTSPQDIRIQ